jgi:hypothetical protein
LPNADPERIEIVVPQPKAAELYYTTCGMVDRHNCHRQDTLMIERKVGTLDWSMRVNLSIFGMLVVDTWLAYSQCTGRNGGTGKDKKQKDFYTYLAEELVDNQYDIVGGNRMSVRGGFFRHGNKPNTLQDNGRTEKRYICPSIPHKKDEKR